MKKTISMIASFAIAGAAFSSVACGDSGEPEPLDPPGGTGGTPGTGGGTPGTGGGTPGTGGDTPIGPISTFVTGGLGESGTWKGYLFTAAAEAMDPIPASTIMPAEFTGAQICATGSLSASYEHWALVGWNIAQEIDPETMEGGAVGTIAPGGTGVKYDIVNNAGSGLRIQLQADDMGLEAWCADVPTNGGSGVIPWASFTKECWTAGGEAYDGTTPLAQVAVQTYAGSESSQTLFDYCVVTLGPAE